MSDNADDQPDGSIEPSVRQITLLDPASGAGDQHGLGVLPPFSGLLQAGRFSSEGGPQRGPPGPPLSYLTLEPLVAPHLREQTVEKHTIERLERVETTDSTTDRGRTDSSVKGDDQETRMTVREFIRKQATEQSTEDSDGPTVADQITQLTDFTQHSTTLHQQRSETGESGETTSAPGSPFDLDHGETDDGSRRDPGRSTSEGTDQPSLTLETSLRSPSRPGTTDQREPRSGSASSHGGRSDTTSPAASPFEAGAEQPGQESGRPDLVLPRRPLTAQRDQASGDPSSIGDPTPGLSSVDRGPSGTESQVGRDSGRSTDALGDRSTAIHQPDSDSPGREPSKRGEAAVPLSLDELERPALDRFVEQLSDELDRHDRIERERRGL